jgi:DNA-binding CsgD family transcriptional regulator
MLRRMGLNGRSRDAESGLDDEQRRLLALMGRGLSVREAGRQLHLSPRTTERRLAQARASLGARTNAEAVLRAEGRGLGPQGERLTAREREVLELVALGFRDEEIADRLTIAPSTVATLLRSSMAKLDARTRVQAVAKLAEIRDEENPSND